MKEALEKQRQSVAEKERRWNEEKNQLQSHHSLTQ